MAAEEARRVREARKGDASAQDDRRRVERDLRKRALGVALWLVRQGMNVTQVARKMGITGTTLMDWDAKWEKNHLAVARRGRAQEEVGAEEKHAVILHIHFAGPWVGLPALERSFPKLSSAVLERLLAQYRRAYWLVGTTLVFTLRWTRAGTVWAMDFTEAPCDIEGTCRWILLVRDLASGFVLAAYPCEHASAATTVLVLRALFRWWGAPLVLKTDNGSHFTAEEVGALLGAFGVVQLLSPPGLPSYNGAIEAGCGSLKTRTWCAAARNDRPGAWTFDDVEEGRCSANCFGSPRGLDGPSPNDAWKARSEITCEERVAFLALVARCEAEIRVEGAYLPDPCLSKSELATIRREAISRALTAHNLLLVRRRKVSPPNTWAETKKIS